MRRRRWSGRWWRGTPKSIRFSKCSHHRKKKLSEGVDSILWQVTATFLGGVKAGSFWYVQWQGTWTLDVLTAEKDNMSGSYSLCAGGDRPPLFNIVPGTGLQSLSVDIR